MGSDLKSHSRSSSRSRNESTGVMAQLQSPTRRVVYIIFFLCAAFIVIWQLEVSMGKDSSIGVKLRENAFKLSDVLTDQDIYGPPIPIHKSELVTPLAHPVKSGAFKSNGHSLRVWDFVPATKVHHIGAGSSVLDNVIILNGTIYIVTDDPTSIPPISSVISSGVSLSAASSSQSQQAPTSKNIQIINRNAAHKLFGNSASRIEGVSFMCYDAPQFISDYYHFIGEVVFGLWRAYSSLDVNITPAGVTSLPPPRRIMLPHVTSNDFKDPTGLTQYALRGAFPSTPVEFSETWADRTDSSKPFIFDRLVLSDRIAGQNGPDWTRVQRYIAPAFDFPGSVAWWSPVRSSLAKFMKVDSPKSKSAKPVITYLSRQSVGHGKLNPADHDKLVAALQSLRSRHGYDVNIVETDIRSPEEQLRLALRSMVILSVHGAGLTHALWMDVSTKPLVMEFFIPEGFSTEYQFPATRLGITYYGWWGDKYFGVKDLPKIASPAGFRGDAIPIDGNAVAALIQKHVKGSG